MESIRKQMEFATKDNFLTTKKMVMEFTFGQTADNTKVGGAKASSMAWAILLINQNNQPSSVYGSLEKEKSGSMSNRLF